jgi:hypothetical protein
MNTTSNTPQIVSAQMISAGIVPFQSSLRPVAVPAGDIDATIAIMDVVASFCATDLAGERFARRFGPAVNALDVATLADGLAATFTERLINHGPSTGSQP